MMIGYMRVSKADGSQVLDLQRDALLSAGVISDRLYEDHASGKRDDRPGLDACRKTCITAIPSLPGSSIVLGAICAIWSTWSTI